MTTTITKFDSCALEHAPTFEGYMVLRGKDGSGKPSAVFVTLNSLEKQGHDVPGKLRLRILGVDAATSSLDQAEALHSPASSPEYVPYSSVVEVQAADIAVFLLRSRAVEMNAFAERLAAASTAALAPQQLQTLDAAMATLRKLKALSQA